MHKNQGVTGKLLRALSRIHGTLTEDKLVKLMDSCLDSQDLYVSFTNPKIITWKHYERDEKKIDRELDLFDRLCRDMDRFTVSMSKCCPQCKTPMDVEDADGDFYILSCPLDYCNVKLKVSLSQEVVHTDDLSL